MLAAPFFGYVADRFLCHRLVAIGACFASIAVLYVQAYFINIYGDSENYHCPINDTEAIGNTRRLEPMHWKNDNRLLYSLPPASIVFMSFYGRIKSLNDVGILARVKHSPKNAQFGSQLVARSFGYMIGGPSYSLSVRFFPHGNTSCFSIPRDKILQSDWSSAVHYFSIVDSCNASY